MAKAVCIPKKMLSPVIILVVMSAAPKAVRVEAASYLSLLINVTTPKIEVPFR